MNWLEIVPMGTSDSPDTFKGGNDPWSKARRFSIAWVRGGWGSVPEIGQEDYGCLRIILRRDGCLDASITFGYYPPHGLNFMANLPGGRGIGGSIEYAPEAWQAAYMAGRMDDAENDWTRSMERVKEWARFMERVKEADA